MLVRPWFSSTGTTFQRLDPDPRIAAVGCAMMVQRVVDGAIPSAKLAVNSVNNDAHPNHLELGDSLNNGWLKIWPELLFQN